MEFRSRAVRSLVELHEVELRNFVDVWERFKASGAAMPEAKGDPDTKEEAIVRPSCRFMADRGCESWSPKSPHSVPHSGRWHKTL